MKTILLSMCLLLSLAGGAWGTEKLYVPDTWVPVCWEKAPGSPYWHPCAEDILVKNGWIEQRHLAWFDRAQEVAAQSYDPCLATMEAAMRAMDIWIAREHEFTLGTDHRYHATIQAARYQMRDEVIPALTQWDQAKACWKADSQLSK